MTNRARSLWTTPPLRWLCPPYNQPLTTRRPADTEAPPGSSLVWVALSGGGTRAAALGWKALETLREIPFPDRWGKPSNLAAEIDYISGISGGSFAAAAWCYLAGNTELFHQRFLDRNIQLRIACRLGLPWNLARIPLPIFNRSHAAAQLYHRHLFDCAAFGNLPPRPELRIHATNLALGARFSFTHQDFALIGSDLDSFPLGYACAASSAFPILLSPMTLLNHGVQLSRSALAQRDAVYEHALRNEEDDVEWHYARLGRDYYNDKSNRYIHLADGGLVDNQGLQAILDEFDAFGLINRRLDDPDNPLERLVLINVNAGTRPDDIVGRHVRVPSVRKVVLYSMVTSMDLLSAKRWIRIREQAAARQRIRLAAKRAGKPSPFDKLEIYTIEISFRNVSDEGDRAACHSLPTSFHLKPEQIALIDRVTPDLIHRNQELLRLREDLARGGLGAGQEYETDG